MLSLARLRVLCVFVFTLSVSGLTQAAYTGLYVFGDSASDTGNVYAATGGFPPFPYFDGNFSNGPVWVDLLGPMLGLASPTASLAGGTNYAWGGARTTIDASIPSILSGIPSTQNQVNTYLIDTGGVADPNALYTIWTGSNDISAVVSGAPSSDIETAGLAVASIANDLLNAGAQNILVINIPNLGINAANVGNRAEIERQTILFNNFVESGLLNLGSSDVTLLDSFALFNLLLSDPSAYGFTNVVDNCLFTAINPVTDCNTHLFWDGHPTTAGHQLIADAAFAAVVPVPAAVWLFGSGLLVLIRVLDKA